MIRRVLFTLAALVASVSPAAAQTVEFLPRYDFHLSADHLSSPDERFVWDTNFGGDIDFVDYGHGRTTFAANYEAVLGDEFRRFDPNQGSYLLDLSSSLRAGGLEIAGVFHHTSRHLNDRFKRNPVDWNMFGVRVGRDVQARGIAVRLRGDALGVLLKSNVDYDWEANGSGQLIVPIHGHVSAVSAGSVRILGVDGTRSRGNQSGAHAEAGLRFEGTAGAIELIVAAERRIDPYPLESSAMSWVSAGFRFVSR